MSASKSSAHWRSCSDIDRSCIRSAKRRHWCARACILASGSSSMLRQRCGEPAPSSSFGWDADGNCNNCHGARGGDQSGKSEFLRGQRRLHHSPKASAAEASARTAASLGSDEKAIAAHMASAAG